SSIGMLTSPKVIDPFHSARAISFQFSVFSLQFSLLAFSTRVQLPANPRSPSRGRRLAPDSAGRRAAECPLRSAPCQSTLPTPHGFQPSVLHAVPRPMARGAPRRCRRPRLAAHSVSGWIPWPAELAALLWCCRWLRFVRFVLPWSEFL